MADPKEREHCCACEKFYALSRAAADVGTMRAASEEVCTQEQMELVSAACRWLEKLFVNERFAAPPSQAVIGAAFAALTKASKQDGEPDGQQ
ncbi:MAG: hypothetical protein KGL39_09075 [Patescibacteria group bacterium]|nr:hypothetical protein [Patescibacteria group bacterium]